MPPTPAPRDEALYHGDSGRPATLEDVLEAARGADVIFFGELHGHPVGARWQARLLEGLADLDRPVVLAMEFFERDTQEALDQWMAGEMDDEAFREATRRQPAYDRTHGPLVIQQRERGWPVVAANAPRPLVSAWRKAEDDYAAWRAALPEEQQDDVARETSVLKDAYWERFAALMGSRAESFFVSQSLWDDTMAESIADARASLPDHRVLLVVGGFHVAGGLGTVTKLRQRRPDDQVLVLTMVADDTAHLPFTEDDRGEGDFLLKVKPPRREPPTGPNPHARPENPHPRPEA